jgi:hypothetical protein
VPKQVAKEVQQHTASNPNWYVITKLSTQKLAKNLNVFITQWILAYLLILVGGRKIGQSLDILT